MPGAPASSSVDSREEFAFKPKQFEVDSLCTRRQMWPAGHCVLFDVHMRQNQGPFLAGVQVDVVNIHVYLRTFCWHTLLQRMMKCQR